MGKREKGDKAENAEKPKRSKQEEKFAQLIDLFLEKEIGESAFVNFNSFQMVSSSDL